MSDSAKAAAGQIGWVDLTVPTAEAVRDFYREVVGWKVSEVEMGGYKDFCMNITGSEKPVAGICHARGNNADLPAQWLIYITVENLDQSMARCVDLGGKVNCGPKTIMGHG